MEYRKYESIKRLGSRSASVLLEAGDKIVIQEKLDGANASFSKGDVLPRAFSRRKELFNTQVIKNEDGTNRIVMGDTLRGFLGFVHENIDNSKLNPFYIYYGEWLVQHSIKYPEKTMYKFYMFDIFDSESNTFLNVAEVQEWASKLGTYFVPTFFIGDYKNPEHLTSFVGKTVMGGMIGDKEKGEGIVIKFSKAYKDSHGVEKMQRYVLKVVSEEFSEYKGTPVMKSPTASMLMQFAQSAMTEARVEKALHKMVDFGLIPEKFTTQHFSIIGKEICTYLVEDIISEESEELPEDYDHKELVRCLNKMAMKMVKKVADKFS